MPHTLSILATAAAVPLLALAAHAAVVAPAGHLHAVRSLPHNLCSSCHRGGQVASEPSQLDAADLVAARSYLPDLAQG